MFQVTMAKAPMMMRQIMKLKTKLIFKQVLFRFTCCQLALLIAMGL